MNREEIIKLIWERKQKHTESMVTASDSELLGMAERWMCRSIECKQILNVICTPAELRKLQEGGKL